MEMSRLSKISIVTQGITKQRSKQEWQLLLTVKSYEETVVLVKS